MAKELSYIERITAFISNMRDNNGVEPGPTPASLTPFSVGQIIKGFDFGNVNNGDVNAELDAFLLGLEVSMEPSPLIVGTSDIMLMATHIAIPELSIDAGVLFGGDFDHQDYDDIVFYYSTDAFELEGMVATKGYQNLTDGKFGYLDPTATSTVSYVREDESLWNGKFVGAVEAEPGPTPPEPGDLTPFESGGSLHAGDKLVVNLNASNVDIANYLSTLTYDPQAYSCLLLDTTNEPEHSGQPFRLAAINFGTNYVLMGTDATGYPSSFWGYDTSTGEGGWQLKEFDGDNYYTIKIEGGVEYYSNIELNDTAEGWNGVFIGVEKGE